MLASAAGRRTFPHTPLHDGDEVDLGGLTLRARRSRTLAVCGGTAREPVQQAVLRSLGTRKTTTLRKLRSLGRDIPEIGRIADAASEGGLLLGPARVRAGRLAALPVALLVALGIARLVNGIHLGRPVGLLVVFLLLTAPAAALLALRPPRVSHQGRRMLAATRSSRSTSNAVYWNDAETGSPVPATVLGVAVLGAAGVSDPNLRTALYGSSSTGSGDSSSSDSFSSDSSSSGGSSCGVGGGGCGG